MSTSVSKWPHTSFRESQRIFRDLLPKNPFPPGTVIEVRITIPEGSQRVYPGPGQAGKVTSLPDTSLTCPKVPHTSTGHLHAEDDDQPFDDDGVLYCGRCHRTWPHLPPAASPPTGPPAPKP